MNCSNKIFLGLGANEGDAEDTIRMVISELQSFISFLKPSSLYRTSPQGYKDQNDFINCVVTGYVSTTAYSLLEKLQNIENKYGRVRKLKNGPRTIDIDILLFGTEIIKSDVLCIPHPRIVDRKFVLIPMLELDWKLSDPDSGRSYAEILNDLPKQGIYYLDLKRYSSTL